MDHSHDQSAPEQSDHGHFRYVQLEIDGQLVDAQVIAREAGRVLVTYPQPDNDQTDTRMQSLWIDEGSTLRIRREDSSWNNEEDDLDWHETQDGY
ncbi:hypothetical protein OK351_09550 [Glutamicibacter sp. MNS18]|uniref:hypothetical protein n=1 Tax=Glutamicibacter sp. MNS18 TaxID=2989817 RepID=UPI0022360FD3|nr:hypothetical protein [Glutamicibacter sp. MNS18]MCW4465751.1 hypothetical protein [Glutamicibacter sp. MNS18]